MQKEKKYAYVDGILELLAEENNRIVVRIIDCLYLYKVRGHKKHKKLLPSVDPDEELPTDPDAMWELLETGKSIKEPSKRRIYCDFSDGELILIKPLSSFAEGDKVRLLYSNGRYTLKNLSLGGDRDLKENSGKDPSSTQVHLDPTTSLDGLKELKKNSGKDPSVIAVIGTLLHLKKTASSILVQMKCKERRIIQSDDDKSEPEPFKKTILLNMPDTTTSDVGVDREDWNMTLGYKEGDEISVFCQDISGTVQYDLTNITLSIAPGKNKSNRYLRHTELFD